MPDELDFDEFYAASFRRVVGQVYAMTGNPAEGSGMDCIGVTPVPAFDLAAGQSVSFKFRVALSADHRMPVHNGSGNVDVTIIRPANHNTEIGGGFAARLPVTVTVG